MKKRGLMILAGMMLLSSVPSFAAGDYSDTAFKFNFSGVVPGQQLHTNPRKKYNNTSCYMKCTNALSGYSYTASAFGAYTESPNTTGYNVGSPSYVFSQGTVIKMVNYVHEKKCPYAMIFAKPRITGTWAASGLWSPDSI